MTKDYSLPQGITEATEGKRGNKTLASEGPRIYAPPNFVLKENWRSHSTTWSLVFLNEAQIPTSKFLVNLNLSLSVP